MTNVAEQRGAVLWAGTDPANRELVVSAASDFKLAARCCALREVLDSVRTNAFDVVGLELGDDPREGLALLKELHDRLPRLSIIVASRDASVPVMRSALERGAFDFLSLPLSRAEVHKALIKFTQLAARQVAAGALGEVITVTAARGGLGATTLAVNLAARLHAVAGADVALVDLDLQRGDVAAFLNLTPSQSLATMATARGEVDDIFLHSTLCRHASGLFVLAAPGAIEEADLVSHEDVQLAIRLLRVQFRYVVIDTPRTVTGAGLAALEDADRVIVLTDLTVPGVRAARRLVELVNRLNVQPERVQVVVTEIVKGPIDLKEAVRTLGNDPVAILPRDEAAGKAMNSGVLLNGNRPTGLTTVLTQLAAKIAGTRAPARTQRTALLRRFFSSKETRS
jgi:pilus assembly protein CpaE